VRVCCATSLILIIATKFILKRIFDSPYAHLEQNALLLCSFIGELPKSGNVDAETCRKHVLACRCILRDNHLTEQLKERYLKLLLHNLRIRYVCVVKMKVDKARDRFKVPQNEAVLTNERSNHDCDNPENY
jgi:hypothetical protein